MSCIRPCEGGALRVIMPITGPCEPNDYRDYASKCWAQPTPPKNNAARSLTCSVLRSSEERRSGSRDMLRLVNCGRFIGLSTSVFGSRIQAKDHGNGLGTVQRSCVFDLTGQIAVGCLYAE